MICSLTLLLQSCRHGQLHRWRKSLIFVIIQIHWNAKGKPVVNSLQVFTLFIKDKSLINAGYDHSSCDIACFENEM